MLIPRFTNSAGKTSISTSNSESRNGFKALNGLVPEYLTSKFVTRNESNYALRDSVNKLVLAFPRTNYTKNGFSFRGATLWNSLPCDIRESASLNQFKRLLYHTF